MTSSHNTLIKSNFLIQDKIKKFKEDNNLSEDMDKIQKQWRTTLNFFANHTKKEINILKEKNLKKYRKKVPELLAKTFESWKWLDYKSNTEWIITQMGIQAKRDLDHIFSTETAVFTSIIALAVSIVSIIISICVILK